MATVAQNSEQTHPRVIESKLRPGPVPEKYAARPRLERLITRLIDRRRVILVTAAAGSGKTTAVAAALRRSKRPAAWLTVDRPDQAAGRLLTYIEASLERQRGAPLDVASSALAAGIPHSEAAGLLAESIGGAAEQPAVIVFDELERLAEAADAWSVVEAVLRYAPTGTCLILISRRDIPSRLCRLPSPAAVAVLTDADLAFTPDEARRALTRAGRRSVEVDVAVQSTAGWVTGVLFESWRTAEHVVGQGGETDPLYDYLSAQILGQIDPDEGEFLIATSVFDELTVPRAEALGFADASELFARLRPLHLPVSWSPDGLMLRCHTYFREYLFAQLERRGTAAIRPLVQAYGRRLAVEGHYEEATEELLRAGALDEALRAAERAIVPVVNRLDFGIAEGWLQALAGQELRPGSPLAIADLMIALARDDIRRGVAVADRLAALGERQTLARSSERAALLMVWCYLHVGRLGDVDAVLEAVEPGMPQVTMRYARDALFGSGERGAPVAPDPAPQPPIGALVNTVHYALGRLRESSDRESTDWARTIEAPWRAAVLRARGRTEQALELFEEARTRGTATPTMLIFAGPEVLMDAGRWEDASDLLREGRALAEVTGSLAYQGMCWVLEAKLNLRWRQDTAAARRALAQPGCLSASSAFRFISEVADTWQGLALLLDGDDAGALEHLRRATDGMVAADRVLELPTAAVYLAEAQWRAGDEDGADAAADVAVGAADRQGSNHVLLQALADFPAVASRRLDAESGADSRWHEIGRALMAQAGTSGPSLRTTVELVEFGRRAIVVDGDEIKPRIAKSYELLSFLAARPSEPAQREELLDALFGERRTDSVRAYLRQAIHQLREVLPDGALIVEGGSVRLSDEAGLASESSLLEQRLAEAARLQGADRLSLTLEALAIYDRGEYMPGPRGAWGDERQQHLSEATAEARYQAAVLSFGEARYDDAARLTDQVLRADPYREAAWRLSMRIAQARGDEDGVLRAYQGCESALADLRAVPAASTRQLLDKLRR
jgi:ATP/maltotriose-dependent transcriptional regulator MalT